jgi:(2Fe-2S) ferredoxin
LHFFHFIRITTLFLTLLFLNSIFNLSPLSNNYLREFLTFTPEMKYDKHIFICNNQRAPGEKKSCGDECGLNLVKEFKRVMKEKGLNKNMRAQRTGCLDACEYGPSLVVYPEGVFYGGVTVNDVPEIVNEHLLNNRVVERLVINFDEQSTVTS